MADGTLDAERAFVFKGVNWSPSSRGTTLEGLGAEFALWQATDIPLMKQMGVNTVRVYRDFGTGADAFLILDELWRHGIKVVMAVDSPPGKPSADMDNVTTIVNAYKNHPAILMWAVGNEWDINKYYDKQKFPTLEAAAAFTEQAAKLIKTLDAKHPVSTIIADPHIPGTHPLSKAAFPYLSGPYTQDIVNNLVPSVDVWGINLYRGNSFGDALLQWRSISTEPAFIGEYGADSYDHRISLENQAMQAQMDAQLWDEAYFDLAAERTAGVLIGTLAFEWNDEWWKNGNPSVQDIPNEINGGQPDNYNDEEWFGVVYIDRAPKQAYASLQNRFQQGQYAVQLDAAPVLTASPGYLGQFKIGEKLFLNRAGDSMVPEVLMWRSLTKIQGFGSAT